MNINKIILPIKREVWEYKASFIGVFLALGGLVIVLTVFGISKISVDPQSIHVQIEANNFEYDNLRDHDIGEAINHIAEKALANLIGSVLHIFVLISGLVTFFYLLGALFDDRKDRSILFWKSMPVSEFQVVLTKFFTGLYAVPCIAALVGLATASLLTLILACWLPFISDLSFFQILGTVRFFDGIAMILLFVLVTGIWFSPFCAWIMLASAFAKKTPIAWTFAPPLLVIFSENMLTGKSTLVRLFAAYMPDMKLLQNVDDHLGLETAMALTKSIFMGVEVYLGILVAAVFLGLCVWLRNNRYEI